jgi:hypothetical protein
MVRIVGVFMSSCVLVASFVGRAGLGLLRIILPHYLSPSFIERLFIFFC